jgi:hypothetical protein
MADENGRPDYAPIPDLQPRLDEKREDLEARIAAMEAAATPPAAQGEPKDASEKARAVYDRLNPEAPKAKKGKK